MAWIYMIPQVIGIMAGKTGGLTLAMWFIFIGYLSVSLSLAWLAWNEHKDRVRLYTVIIFGQWTIFILTLFLMCVSTVRWSSGDTLVCVVVALLSVVTVWKGGLQDPMTRGWLAVWCKGLSQLWMAYVMWQSRSSEWLPALSLLATNATAIPRLVQVYLQGTRGGWDRPTKGLILGESANVITWLIVTLVWILLRIN